MAPAYKLTYFEYSGLGECIRWLFNYGGVEFEDKRIPMDKWTEFKDKMPYGQLPVLEYNGEVVTQSIAISRHLAKKFNLHGKDDWEDLKIDSLVDTMSDWKTKVFTFSEDKEAKKTQLTNEVCPFYCKRFNKNSVNGYLVGGHLTWADFYFVALVACIEKVWKIDAIAKYPNLIKVKNNVLNVPEIKEWIAKRPEDKLNF